MSVSVLVTPRLRTAYKRCVHGLPAAQLRSEEFQQIAAIFHAAKKAAAASKANEGVEAVSPPPPPMPAQTITFAQVQTLSQLVRSTFSAEAGEKHAGTDADVSEDESIGQGFVHELLRGSSVSALPVARSGRRQDPAFKRYLEEQRIKQDRRDYARLVADLPGNKNVKDPDSDMGSSYASASRDVGHGLNVLTLMVTGFVVFYYVGTGLFPHNDVFAVLLGLVGLIGALMVEVCLFLVRDEKTQMGEAQQRKFGKAQKQAEAEYARREHDKTETELKRRQQMLQDQSQAAASSGTGSGTGKAEAVLADQID